MSRRTTADARIEHHYRVEKELAARLREAPPESRLSLYNEVYSERLERIPHHPLIERAADPVAQASATRARMGLLDPWLCERTVVLEIGPGDCAVARAVSARVRRVYAVDVSDGLVSDEPLPENVELIISDGVSIPVPAGSVDVAYSDQVMEHLHPDDAEEQLRGVYRALAVGGRYLCITPNRLSGPWDVSRGFDEAATGLHLREYSIGELCEVLRSAGFQVRVFGSWGARRLTPEFSPQAVVSAERFIERLPRRVRRRLAHFLVAVKVVGRK